MNKYLLIGLGALVLVLVIAYLITPNELCGSFSPEPPLTKTQCKCTGIVFAREVAGGPIYCKGICDLNQCTHYQEEISYE